MILTIILFIYSYNRQNNMREIKNKLKLTKGLEIDQMELKMA